MIISKRLLNHIFIPSIAPLAVIGLYFMPVAVLGCRNRGIIAISVVFLSLIIGIGTAIVALLCRIKGDRSSDWWIVSTCILVIPTLLVLGPLG